MVPDGIQLDQTGPLLIARLQRAEITSTEMQALIDECSQRMRYLNARQFIFDLGGVEFLASACLGLLVGFMQEVEHFRGRIAVASCQPNVAFLFTVTQLDRVFGLYESAADAAEALTERRDARREGRHA